ncbi:hyperosmotically inducible protein [Paraburkholderia sp. WC7.3g]|uniref:BON domain-containing protein n=1 Tax=Paraburkholderia sp. WC7.3g TaxID=2991070 RepID=UPI003D1D9DAC
MKAIQAIKLAGGALIIAVSVGAWAQASDAMGSMSAPSSDQMSAKSMTSADRALSKKVRAALVKAKDVTASGIVVRAKSGAVTLEGTVPEQAQVDTATEVAKGVAGVTSVKNALSIKEEGR